MSYQIINCPNCGNHHGEAELVSMFIDGAIRRVCPVCYAAKQAATYLAKRPETPPIGVQIFSFVAFGATVIGLGLLADRIIKEFS